MSGAWTPGEFDDDAMDAKPGADLDDVMRVLVWLVEDSGKVPSSFRVNVALARMERMVRHNDAR
jgi:hypothetical protein